MTASDVTIRLATRDDLPAIVALFAEDTLHAAPATAARAPGGEVAVLDAMLADPNNRLFVAELGGSVVGTFQLTFIPQLSYGGCWIAELASVFVRSDCRSQGVGAAMVERAIAEARRRGCLRVQLTSNSHRTRAHAFYERLGFRTTHQGMKLYLV